MVTDSERARGQPAGARVISVADTSPAAKGGLLAGDVITRVGADSVADVPATLAAIRALKPGVAAPVRVRRGGRAVVVSLAPAEWPRESAPDFDVWYTQVSAPGGRRRVIVTHPRDATRQPAILFVGGLGCYSIDAPWGPDGYRDLLYHFTRRGYATVRVEKSGVGDSEGAPCPTVDFENELAGYAAALRALRTYPFVDPARVFILGHSIGGIAGPALVDRDSSAVPIRGIAVISTVGIAWYEYELNNLRRQLVLGGLAPDSVEQVMALKERCGYRLLVARERADSIAASDPICKTYVTYPVSDRYLQQVAALNIGALWRGVRARVLVVYPASDFITSRDEHHQLVSEINAMHPGMATYAEVPEVDHYLAEEPSVEASFRDTIPWFRRGYSTRIEPVLDAWFAQF